MDTMDGVLCTALYEMLSQHTDPHDMADNARGYPQFRRTSKTLLANLRGEGRPDRLTMAMVKDHLSGDTTLHTVPLRGASRVWVQFDVDAHHGETDARGVADFLHRLFPKPWLYEEPSTGGQGYHLYAWLCTPQDLVRHNETLARCAQWLARLLRHHGFAAPVEIKHTFTRFNLSRHEIVRGQTAKVPRLPQGLESLHRLSALPTINLKDLTHRIRSAGHLAGVALWGRPMTAPLPTPRGHLPNTSTTHGLGGDTSNTIASGLPRRDSQPALNTGFVATPNSGSTLYRDPNAFVRMQAACFALQGQLGRRPDQQELLDFYQRTHGGDATAARARRARDVLRYADLNFDPAMVSSNEGFMHHRPRLLQLAGSIGEEHRSHRTIAYPHRLDDEDLAIGLFVLECAALHGAAKPDLRYSMAIGSIAGMFEALREEGQTRRKCSSKKKERAILRVLELADLLRYLDQKKYVTRYVGRKVGLGPTHPMHSAFERRLAQTPVVTTFQIRLRWAREEADNTNHARTNAGGTPTPSKDPFDLGDLASAGFEAERSSILDRTGMPPPASARPSPPACALEQFARFSYLTAHQQKQLKDLQARLDLEEQDDKVAARRIQAFLKPLRALHYNRLEKRNSRDRALRQDAAEILREWGYHGGDYRSEVAPARAKAMKEARRRRNAKRTQDTGGGG
ncbi:MAG: hypothetical protein NTW19_04175 [Planctomycetota bacterium]|nr:hypothetical protein [Planctomycetota bacterium]